MLTVRNDVISLRWDAAGVSGTYNAPMRESNVGVRCRRISCSATGRQQRGSGWVVRLVTEVEAEDSCVSLRTICTSDALSLIYRHAAENDGWIATAR